MAGSRALQLRWIWVSVYIIAGSLALAHLLFATFGTLPGGIFYAGFGGACFIGAALAALQSRGTSVVEASIAALFIGILNLVIIVLFTNFDRMGVDMLKEVSAPLSTTFVCFAGALAGGRIGTSWHEKHQHSADQLRLAITAILVLVGATATHAALIAVVAEASEGLAIFLGIFLFFTTPAMAGAALQLTVRKNILSSFAGGLILANISFLAIASLAQAPHLVLYKLIATSFALGLFSLVSFVLVIPGVVSTMHSKAWLAEGPSTVPKAVVQAGGHRPPRGRH